jgi:hypothetical protein
LPAFSSGLLTAISPPSRSSDRQPRSMRCRIADDVVGQIAVLKAVPTWLTYMCAATDTEGPLGWPVLLPLQIPREVLESSLLPLQIPVVAAIGTGCCRCGYRVLFSSGPAAFLWWLPPWRSPRLLPLPGARRARHRMRGGKIGGQRFRGSHAGNGSKIIPIRKQALPNLMSAATSPADASNQCRTIDN